MNVAFQPIMKLGRVLELQKQQILPNLRSKPETFSQTYRGTSRESNAAGDEKAVKDAHN